MSLLMKEIILARKNDTSLLPACLQLGPSPSTTGTTPTALPPDII